MKLENEGAQRYFDRIPEEWDALYAHEHWLMYRINRLLRPGIYERYEFTFARCQPIEGGIGTGHRVWHGTFQHRVCEAGGAAGGGD